MARRVAARLAEIAPFRVMALLARARELEAQGRSIVHMEIGEPDFATPEPVAQAALAAIRAGHTHYTPALGLPALREAIAQFYLHRFGVSVAAERIVITPGASGALLLALGTVVDRDEEVLLADPGYPCNRHFIRFIEGRTRAVPVGVAERYQLTAATVAEQWCERTVGALVASPSNPTGTLIPPAELAQLSEVVEQRGGALIVDEIYGGLTYGSEPTSVLAVNDNAWVINSFSKYFCMTGWRLGWLVVPPGMVEPVERLMQNLFIAAATPSQYAALAAFQPESIEILEQRREAFRQRRDFLLPALRELGFTIEWVPEGAFYLYADSSRLTDDSEVFAGRLLEEAGVAVTPGNDFGAHRAHQHLRFAYTTSLPQLEEGVERIARFLRAGG